MAPEITPWHEEVLERVADDPFFEENPRTVRLAARTAYDGSPFETPDGSARARVGDDGAVYVDLFDDRGRKVETGGPFPRHDLEMLGEGDAISRYL